MKIGRLFPDLLATLGRAASSEAGFTRTLKQLVALSGARAGGLRFRPGDGAPMDVIVGARRLRARAVDPGAARAAGAGGAGREARRGPAGNAIVRRRPPERRAR